jgi:hypothetical protein
MKAVALERFSHFTDAEIDALYAFLTARATVLPQLPAVRRP